MVSITICVPLGWGHSSCEKAAASAATAGVKKLVLFHHDPARTDEQIEELERNYQPRNSGGLEIVMAREELTVEA